MKRGAIEWQTGCDNPIVEPLCFDNWVRVRAVPSLSWTPIFSLTSGFMHFVPHTTFPCVCVPCALFLVQCEKIIDINKGHIIYAISEEILTTTNREEQKKKTTLWRNNALEWISVGLIFSVKCLSLHLWQLGRWPCCPFFFLWSSSLFHFHVFALTLMATGFSNKETKGPFPWRYFCIYVWGK